MRFSTWLRNEDRSHPAETRRGHGRSRRQATVHPRLEMLEGRRVLSTLTVTSSSDNLAGSLRAEITAAQPGDTIDFASGLRTITLSGSELEINKNLTIQGPGFSELAISGNNLSRVFEVDAGANVTISGLTIEGGTGQKYHTTTSDYPDYYDGLGGGIRNLGTLALSGCNVTNNYAHHGPAIAAEGGGVYNNGTLTLSGGCNVTGNAAYPTYASNGTALQPSEGGGIFNDKQGSLTILSSVVTNNTASDGADICNLGTMTISKDSTIGKVSRK